MRYELFAGQSYEAPGGMRDHVGNFWTFKAADRAIIDIRKADRFLDWFHIRDRARNQFVEFYYYSNKVTVTLFAWGDDRNWVKVHTEAHVIREDNRWR